MLNLEPIGRQHFDPTKPTKLPQYHIELWPGYLTRVNLTSSGIVLVADLAHKVLRTGKNLNLHSIKMNESSIHLLINLIQRYGFGSDPNNQVKSKGW